MHHQLGLKFDSSVRRTDGQKLAFFQSFYPDSKSPASRAEESDCLPNSDNESESVPLGELLKVHDYERQRMGRELHDSTGQLITALELSIAHLKRIDDDCSHLELFSDIESTVRQINQEIRTLAFLDYPLEAGGESLTVALRSLARGLQKRTAMHIVVQVQGEIAGLSDLITLTMLRVAQEALTNIYRHAHASSAKVVLKKQAGTLELIISDDGIGVRSALERTTTIGIGLKGMRHRVESLGGRLKIINLTHGTRVSACVPIRR